MKRKLKAGSTSVMIPIRVWDSSSSVGAGLGSLAHNTAGLTAKYRREGAASWTTITLASATAGTFTSSGFATPGSGPTGAYELHIPDAALASGADWVEIELYGAANMVPVSIEIELDAIDYQDAVRLGLTALPNAAPDAAGGLPISDAGGLDLDAQVGTKINDILTDTGTTLQGELDGIQADTEDIQSRLPAALVGGRIDANMGAISGDSVAADNLEAYTDGTTAAPVNVTQISGDATAADNAESFFDGTGYAGTGNVIPTVTNVTTVDGLAANTITASAIADGAIDNGALAADTGLKPLRTGTAQAGALSNITLDSGASSVNDYYLHANIYIVSGTGAGQAGRVINGYVGSTKVATVLPDWKTNPDNTSVFVIKESAESHVRQTEANVITASSIATDAITEIQSGLATQASVDTIDDLLDTEIASIISALTTIDDFLDTEIAAIKAKTDQLTFTNTNKVDASLQAAADVATAVAQKLAHVVLRRTMTNVEGASDGDTLDLSSLYGLVQMLQEASISGTTLTVNKVGGSAALGTKTLTSSASADPITAIE